MFLNDSKIRILFSGVIKNKKGKNTEIIIPEKFKFEIEAFTKDKIMNNTANTAILKSDFFIDIAPHRIKNMQQIEPIEVFQAKYGFDKIKNKKPTKIILKLYFI